MAANARETEDFLTFGPFRIDCRQRALFNGPGLVPLAPKTFDMLLALVEGDGRILEKDALLKRVWPDTFVEENSLARTVSMLRKVLGQSADDQTYIETVPKRGYRFVAPVRRGPDRPAPVEALPEPARTASGARRAIKIAASILAGIALAHGIGWFRAEGRSHPMPTVRLGFTVPAAEPFQVYTGEPSCAVALSRDGAFLVYSAISLATNRSHLYLRPLDRFDARLVPDSESGYNPFVAPDGRSVGFFTDDALVRASLDAGRTEVLAPVRLAAGGAEWEDDGTIIFDTGHGLGRIDSRGGATRELTQIDAARGEVNHLWPHLLPDGRHLLFTVKTATSHGVDVRIDAIELPTGRRWTVLGDAGFARYVPNGRLIYSVRGVVYGVVFDAARAAVAGAPVKLLEDVAAANDSAHLSVSRDGTLAYVRGRPVDLRRSLAIVDRSGAPTLLPAPPHGYQGPRVSPDGRQLLVFMWESGLADVWTYDLTRGGLTRRTSSGAASNAIWSPDGRAIVYQDMREGAFNVAVQSIESSAPARIMSPTSQQQWPHAFLDRRTVIFTQADPGPRHGNVWISTIDADAAQRELLPRQPYEQWGGWPSPDRRWLAYVSDETGRFEVYVSDVPRFAQKWQISTGGGQEPVWSKTRPELFYREGPRMLSVTLDAASSAPVGKPVLLFEGEYVACCAGLQQFDTTPDGRFVMIKDTNEPAFTELRIVKSWTTELAANVK